MEGAVESGKITANLILDKYKKEKINHYKHTDSQPIRVIQKLDNLLYKFNLPNIATMIIFFTIFILTCMILIFIISIIYKTKNGRKLYKKILRMGKMGRHYA